MKIGLVTSDQHDSLVDLLLEVHRYYNPGSTTSRDVVHAHAAENLLCPHAPHRLVVASRTDGKVVGLAAIALVYSFVDPEPEKRKHCQMKELYVSATGRSRGVGRALMAWVADYARVNGCQRVDWPVKAANSRGIVFYEDIGARLVEDRLSYRLSEPHLGYLADQSNPPRGSV